MLKIHGSGLTSKVTRQIFNSSISRPFGANAIKSARNATEKTRTTATPLQTLAGQYIKAWARFKPFEDCGIDWEACKDYTKRLAWFTRLYNAFGVDSTDVVPCPFVELDRSALSDISIFWTNQFFKIRFTNKYEKNVYKYLQCASYLLRRDGVLSFRTSCVDTRFSKAFAVASFSKNDVINARAFIFAIGTPTAQNSESKLLFTMAKKAGSALDIVPFSSVNFFLRP